jgi:hypothetical protein
VNYDKRPQIDLVEAFLKREPSTLTD